MLASILAVSGMKMVIENVYTDDAALKTAGTEIDKALKVIGEHNDVPVVCGVSDSWEELMRKSTLAVSVKCMGVDATVSTAVGQYLS